ncbi:MAG: hypothetical protein A2667_02045 [Candidatus Wildermuthbacteria bacterium RIFCSPHIGHO2_01_FULL_47_27]|uniref:FAD-binding domain-containing protein n=1 Tax=Candidatus Wildermuthbacteria bacterium RIFCSPHIGHO2_02_FULL_47_17 TaxID=1802452 RepID=A0A1G2R5W8_9BACT|nr:MAG: Geranylgeranyl reductase [Parcubacteria group bacterium GW2011_GWA2_47_9]OHA64304.1 MAG: hypothetical protein A2667_02045 [Candidatus Wildermuthbacteria bacterium RIFCSPHIGHO2_01_FULL_47_27]OHA67958.1 MAG: hypothetical protein A3D59_02920 [Candidatus Wildermuthbacteria bacterium RIFCSPHIGHO2_02_FULL_47_17]OHA75937.1 MAG: hypothetical protein A3I38_04015 [Candidatus Wildermuthbacteria bacterium RIFCSPLOWO2_02_FULL_47_10]
MEGSRRPKQRVAIFGAGAVGLYLAWKLSQLGHVAVVFEKMARIEIKPCSGLISETACRMIPGMERYVENRILSCRIHFPRKTINLSLKPTFVCVPRKALNERLFRLAQSSAVSVVYSSSFNGSFAEELLSRFDRIVGCDGAFSAVRKACRLGDPKMKLGLQAIASVKDDSVYADVWPEKGGFFWRIPRGETVEYGIMGARSSAHGDFIRLIAELGVSDLGSIKSAPIPCGLRLPDNPRITLCGDAAGLTKPWSGGGLLWGFRAADILAECFPDFTLYRQRMRRVFMPQIIGGRALTSFMCLLGNKIPFLLPANIGYDNDFLPLPTNK